MVKLLDFQSRDTGSIPVCAICDAFDKWLSLWSFQPELRVRILYALLYFCFNSLNNITVIPAMELSTHLNGEDIHVLAYFKGNNFKNKEILNYLEKQKKSKIPRIIKTLELLKEHYNIDIEAGLLIKNGNERSITSSYILEALIEGGHVKNLNEAIDK